MASRSSRVRLGILVAGAVPAALGAQPLLESRVTTHPFTGCTPTYETRLADVDGDGRTDLITRVGDLCLMLRQADGSFGAPRTAGLPAEWLSAFALFFHDLNRSFRDGRRERA